jgi:uridine kinase
VIDAPFLIVEGLYAMRADIADLYDARIWVEGRADTRMARVMSRDGPSRIDRWRDEWLPLEQTYIEREQPWRRADLFVAGADLRISDVGRQLAARQAVP